MKKKRKITEIKIKDSNHLKRLVYIDNNFFIETDDIIVSEMDLFEGKIVSENIYSSILQKTLLKKAKNDAIRFLSYRARSEWEIVNKLKNKNYPQPVIINVINWLKENDFINDINFSHMWIKNKLENNPIGRFKIKSELKNKGIDNNIIEKTIAKFLPNDDDELKLAYQLIKKKNDSLKLKNIELEHKKIINLLKSRGFSYNVISRIYNEYNNDSF
ncbi:MAG: regulatory protein RecX [Candidatus Caldatribacteriota bacterium]